MISDFVLLFSTIFAAINNYGQCQYFTHHCKGDHLVSNFSTVSEQNVLVFTDISGQFL